MNDRKSGVLLHITSLPGKEGIGTMGREAFAFADWLHQAGQSLWQVLPLGPTGYGDSPYASFSTFAGNPLLIDLGDLVERGWAKAEDVAVPDYIRADGPVDFGSVVWWKTPALYSCASYFLKNVKRKDYLRYEKFKADNSGWLDGFAAFMSIKKVYDEKARKENIQGAKTTWNAWWPKKLASHQPEAVSEWVSGHEEEIEEIKAIQFFFREQWNALKKHVNSLDIQIIGDIPIFVAADSADLWANQGLFQFDAKKLRQKSCAGVPPDYFSATGQLWGNPLYDWDAMKADGYRWWIARIKNMLSLVDIVRIDHFRAFDEYWQIPYGAEDATGGKWKKGPGMDLFNAIKDELGTLPIIAEDLGTLTPGVEKLRSESGFPGMKILQFAFDGSDWNADSAQNAYLPHNITDSNCVIYTGTHDNDTSMGWIEKGGEGLKKNLCRYFNLYEDVDNMTVAHSLIRAAFSSTADTCIIPLQDIYSLGSDARLNTPSTASGNWSWRMPRHMTDERGASELAWYSKLYGRNQKREQG